MEHSTQVCAITVALTSQAHVAPEINAFGLGFTLCFPFKMVGKAKKVKKKGLKDAGVGSPEPIVTTPRSIKKTGDKAQAVSPDSTKKLENPFGRMEARQTVLNSKSRCGLVSWPLMPFLHEQSHMIQSNV